MPVCPHALLYRMEERPHGSIRCSDSVTPRGPGAAARIDGTASSTANSSNEVSFRWTNAVVPDLLAGLSPSKKNRRSGAGS
jgi:hypothetical protein